MMPAKRVKEIIKEIKDSAINPLDPINWDKPLWVIYGSTYHPSILCCKVNNPSGYPCIWGYSVWKNKAGFRTIGQDLTSWMSKSTDVLFFETQLYAITYLTYITHPKTGVV